MALLIQLSIVLLFAALQTRLPTLWWLGGLRLEFFPALAACGALVLRPGRALLFALVAGFVQDALSAAPFGISSLAYGVVCVMLTGMREALDRDLPWVPMGAGALMSTAASLAAMSVVGVSFGGFVKLVLLAAISGVITMIASFAYSYLRLVTR